MTAETVEKYGRLSLVRHAEGRPPRFYVFACDCGGEKVASIYDVRRGMTTSCGCLKRESAAEMRSRRGPMVNDLSGRRFGMLTVLGRAENNRHGCAVWNCRCDCGTEKKVSGNHLVTGNTASCGCAYRERKAVRPAEARKRSNDYVKSRNRSDVRYAINRRTLNLVHASIKARGSAKSERWERLVGYSLADLDRRLLETMPEGYTWDDFLSGALHIDHKIPLSAFNFTRAEDFDFRRAWALSNLQLLPAEVNVAKSDSLDEPFQPSLGF